jgi:hypothetical protein
MHGLLGIYDLPGDKNRDQGSESECSVPYGCHSPDIEWLTKHTARYNIDT